MKKREKLYWQTFIPIEEPRFDGLSWILFDDHMQSGTILACDTDDPRVRMGASFWTLSEMTEEYQAKIRNAMYANKPIWIKSPLGMGVLYPTYCHNATCYVYVHVHGDPHVIRTAIRRLGMGKGISACPYGRNTGPDASLDLDEMTLGALQRASEALDTVTECMNMPRDVWYGLGQVMGKGLQELADALHVKLSLPNASMLYEETCRCYNGANLQLQYLFWLLLFKEIAVDGCVCGKFYYIPNSEQYLVGVVLTADVLPIENIERLSCICQATDALITLGEGATMLVEMQWKRDLPQPQMEVDIQCMGIPSGYIARDGKEGVLPLKADLDDL